MGDGAVSFKCCFQGGDIRRCVFESFLDDIRAIDVIEDLRHPLTVSAVNQNERLAVPWDQGAERRLDDKRPTALQGNADVGFRCIGDLQ